MTKTENEILKKTLRHYIDLEYYANSVDADIQELLNDLVQDCESVISSQKSYGTKASYNLSYKAIKEKVEEFGKKLRKRLEEEAESIMNEEEEFLDSLYNKPDDENENVDSEVIKDVEKVVKAASVAGLIISGVSLAKLLFAPMDGRDTTKQFVERTEKTILQTYDTAIRAGYLFSQEADDIKAQTKNKMSQISRGIQSGIRTAIPSYAKTVDRIIFLNNDSEVIYCAILDGSTCLVCGTNHGRHFPSISTAPAIPVHANCRCVYIRAMDVTEPMPTYEEFISSLSEKEQKEILGPNRYDLWKNYDIPLERFVNDGKKLRLDEINKT